MWRDRQFLHAVAVLIGTMVGVGVFGIPFVFSKAGFAIGLIFLIIIAGVTCILDLLFAEVVLRTHEKHQLVGYARMYLGPGAQRLMLFTSTLGIYGALLAYINVAGEFLHTLSSSFSSIPPAQYSAIFFVVASVGLLFRFRTMASVEFFMTGLCIAVVALIFALGMPHIRWPNLVSVTPEFWFWPYGVLLFAFGGITSIPFQREILRRREHDMVRAVLWAVGTVAVLYGVFAFTVVGVSGDVTTPDALSGLADILGTPIILLGSLFGVVAIGTSYLMLGTALIDVFRWDYGVKKVPAWLLTVVPPMMLFWSGLRSFIQVIGLVGAVAVGIESLVLVALYVRAKERGNRIPEFSFMLPRGALYGLAAFFLAGIGYALIMN